MEGIGQIEHAGGDAALAGQLGEIGDRRHGAGDADRAGAVDGGDFQPVQAGFGEQGQRRVAADIGDRHAAEAEGGFLLGAAVKNDVDGFVEADGAAGFGGGDLAQAVAEHGIGTQAGGGEAGGERRLDGEEQRLDQFGLAQRAGEIGIVQRLGERPGGGAGEAGIDLGEAGAEGRVGGVGGAAHADPLAAVAGIDESDAGWLRGGDAFGARLQRAGFGIGAQ